MGDAEMRKLIPIELSEAEVLFLEDALRIYKSKFPHSMYYETLYENLEKKLEEAKK